MGLKKIIHFVTHHAIRMARLSHTTNTGLRIPVKSEMEWRIYNDIFVNREYDEAIVKLLSDKTSSSLKILDLGCNVGFFLFRLLHMVKESKYNNNVYILGIDASATLCSETKQRLHQSGYPDQQFHVKIENGLIGKTQGEGTFYHFKDHGLSSVFRRDGNLEIIPYVNIEELVADWKQIDLVKCDIEGSEEKFISHYSGVIEKTRVAIFEFHTEFCNYDKCITKITDSGLVHSVVITRSEHSVIQLFWR